MELPSYLVGCFAMDRIGRKKTCAPALLLGGVACMLIIVVPAVRTCATYMCVCVFWVRGNVNMQCVVRMLGVGGATFSSQASFTPTEEDRAM